LVRILVVDDEPDLRHIMRRIFERAGHDVTDTSHGAAALDAVHEALPDLVITDMMMPVMGGAELIRRLRADPRTAQIPILAATSDAQQAGNADLVLVKPYQPRQILAAANALLAKKADQE
jgi:CheY-like chemotaxis protein